MGPIFEDINIYQLDARLLGVPNASLLPPPRSSTETIAAHTIKFISSAGRLSAVWWRSATRAEHSHFRANFLC